MLVDNPAHLPDPSVIEEIREPIVKCLHSLCPNEYIGDIMQLIMEKRGTMDHTESLDTRRVMLHCELPLNEILVDFNDKIKSITPRLRLDGLRARRLSRLQAGEARHARERRTGRRLFDHRASRQAPSRAAGSSPSKLKEVIPTQLYQVAIQAAIGGKIVARETISAPCAKT